MSQSPGTAPANGAENANKKRRLESAGAESMNAGESPSSASMQGSAPHIPKRGARACTNCRKGKNRCEGEPPCRRCLASGTPCVFEKPEKKNVQALAGPSAERLTRLEGQFLFLQSQMIGMQTSLDRILSAVDPGAPHPAQMAPPPPGYPPPGMEPPRDPSGVPQPPRTAFEMPPVPGVDRSRAFPPLPGFAPPPHKYASYGIIPSTAASSEDESEDTLPRSTINAPIEALQGLANAAAEAAAAPSAMSPRVKKRKRAEPTPRNAFPHVVDKGLVSDPEARELFNIFFAGCHLFIPLFDPAYDTYESLKERSPWTFDAILAIAAKIRSGNGPLSGTFYKCLEEAQGIARSSLFGPVVRKEAVQGMLLLAAWSTNGWLPSGHAMRMALDLGLHRALEKLADDSGKQRTEEEERNLVVSARIWLCLYWFDHQMSLGTGRPIVLRDESSIRHCRILLNHPMASVTDIRLIALVEMVAQKTQIYETLIPLNGQINHNALAFIRRANIALDKWWTEHDELHRKTMDQESLLRKLLAGELHYAKLWLVCLALRGVAWDKMPFEQRELAFQAKDAASNCLAIFLNSGEYRSVLETPFHLHNGAYSDSVLATPIRAALRYAVHDSLVTAAFSGLFLLKMASLFPREVDLGAITAQVEQMAQLLSDVAAERYAFTLRIMLANLRRRVGIPSGINTAVPMPPPSFAENMVVSPTYVSDPSMPPPFTMEELGFAWPNEGSFFSPAAIPPWLQEQSLTDLGLPVNGSDGIFLQPKGTNGWSGDFPPMPEAW
ncbi:hypothetical protein DFP72DRAFT_1062307 [Ephemerocybe angulata]|uniref:Zn(2)-C6 fungal-type domain-containing protein n=1 Tax=Ephemerocybe angulata TaxID=980116 RepID=A0A8H6I999_9AGAR|nr:hypothetical protein DFP72DRAFT_1063394 [Tulosesus angulatus]KAF6761295.1 hypothetical protein DFP72DRAFT_1062307 [Tulosesus angulatus]